MTTCHWCKSAKENETGICGNCHRFPPASKKGLSYFELNPNGATSLHLKHVSTRIYNNTKTPVLSDVDSKSLADTITALLKSVAVDRKRGEWDYEIGFGMRGSMTHRENNIVVPTEVALNFFSFYKAFSDATHNTYAAGLERGKNLLAGLNDGTYTLNDFNQQEK